MNIYKISQDSLHQYDTYDSAIVIAKSAKEARTIHPRSGFNWNGKCDFSWPSVDFVTVELIGKAKSGMKKGVIVSSFNAG